jgi:hypothetical protein
MFRRLFSLTLTCLYLVVLIVAPVFASSCRPRQEAGEFSRTNREATAPDGAMTEPAAYGGEQQGRGGYGSGSGVASLPRRPAPEGMLELPTGGVGRILTSRMGGTNSARKMLMALNIGIDGYFDSAPRLTAAAADRNDQNLQAAFIARLGGVPVRGIIAIEMQGNSGQATMIFDQQAAFPQTFSRLTQRLSASSGQGGGGGGGAPAPVRLTPAQFPDGSGQIGLPPGFHITNSYKGTVDVAGPNGEGMSLGGYATVTYPQSRGMFQGVPVVSSNDPVRAVIDLQAFYHQRIKIIDARPVQVQANGRWAFIRYSTNNSNGQPVEGLGLFGMMPIDQTQGLLYQSYVNAPPQVFRQSLPAMWAAWQSWGIKDQVFKDRMTATLNSMRETGDILTSANQNRQDTYARVNQAWSNEIRDEGMWRIPGTGRDGAQVRLRNDNDITHSLEPVPIGDLQP